VLRHGKLPLVRTWLCQPGVSRAGEAANDLSIRLNGNTTAAAVMILVQEGKISPRTALRNTFRYS
jgi:hypothetical protein